MLVFFLSLRKRFKSNKKSIAENNEIRTKAGNIQSPGRQEDKKLLIGYP